MGRRGMPGRRRQLIQLDNAPKTSYLTQTGCYRPDDIFIESKNVVKSSLSLVCDYTGSDSESEEESDKGENDSTLNRNGDDVNSGNDAKDNLHAEMLGIVGTKVETPSDIFRREFNAYQKETAAPSYNREFIAFQKETSPSLSTSSNVTTEMVTTSTTQSQKANVPLKENSTTSADSKTVPGSTETPESVSKSSDIDSQVASFLAEIDALGEDAEVKNKETDAEDKNVDPVVDSTKDDQSLGSDAKEGTDASGEVVSVVASYKSSGDSSSGEEEPVVWPEEPVSEWQQCHDESTQHYYYWNINSNEVTWEIPPEFTQYLLLYKEYELTLSRLIKEGKTKPKKKKTKSKRDPKKKNGQDKSESSAISTEEKTVSESAESSELQPDNVSDKKDKTLSEETDVEPKLVQETASPDMTENPQCSPGNSENINNEETMESDSKISSAVSSSPAAESLEMTTDKYTEGTACAVDGNGAHTTNNTNCNSSNSSTSSSNPESLASTVNISDLTIEMCKKKFKARMHREDTTSNKQEQQATLELNPDTNTTVANNKEASPGSDSEQSNIDIDEVDRELELALERKVNELRRLEEEEKQCEVSDRHHVKRKHKESDSGRTASRNSSDEDYCMSKPPKKSKTHKHASKRTKEKKESSSSKRSESSKKRSSHKDHQSKKESRSKSSKSLNYKSHSEESSKSQESNEKLKETVMDLNQLVMDKMDFLEIDINKPSKLQVLLVQLKTRSSDWQAGGLSTSYFFERLQEANQQIIQFEKSGAPTGWSVCWDRTYKRYFYCNNTTGHSQWDYPEQPTKEELNGMSESMQQSLTLALSSTPPPPPPTPPPTPSPSVPSSSSSSMSSSTSSSSAAATTTTTVTSPVHESTKTASPVRSTSSEEKINYGQESGEMTKCSDNFKKEKKNRKLDKIASKSSKTGNTLDKSHLEHLHLSSSKDFDSELCVYPGEPPPPGTEVSKQHSLQHLEEVKLSKSGEEDLEEVMKLAAVLAPTGTSLASSTASSELASLESSERTSTLDVNDDMELDPDEHLPSSVHPLPMHSSSSSSSYKSAALSSNSNSNGHHLFPLVDAANCENNSAVISKPPQYKTRPTVPSDPVGGTLPTSNSDASTVYSSKTNPAANSSMECFSLSKSSAKVSSVDSANASNSPVSHETNDAVDTVKPQPKEKKRKKDKVITSTNLTLKKKNVSSLVQKWQKVKKEVEKEDELARHEFSDDD